MKISIATAGVVAWMALSVATSYANSVEGKVTCADNGAPLGGVRVFLSGFSNCTPFPATGSELTDADGNYIFYLGDCALPVSVCIDTTTLPPGTTVNGDTCVAITVDTSLTINFSINCTPPPPAVSADCVTVDAVQGVPITPVTLTGSGGCGGPYTFSASGLPTGLTMSTGGTISGTPTVTGTFSYSVTITDNCGNTGTINCSVTVAPGAFGCTFTPGGWGAPPNGNNVATILYAMFPSVYPSGFTVGGTYTIKFTSASAITVYLPAGKTPGVLKQNYVNPTVATTAGEFADQVIALKLNVDASNHGFTEAGLASLKVAAGNPLAGYTVGQLLTLANQVLGGNTAALPAGVTVPIFTELLSSVNGNFDNCVGNKGVLTF